MQPLSIHTHYREKFSKRYPFHEAVSFQFSEQNRKVSPIGFESEDYMLHGQRAFWTRYPCSNGKLPFSHCQGNIAESTKLEVTATLVFLLSFLFFFLYSATYLYHQMARVPVALMVGITTMTVKSSQSRLFDLWSNRMFLRVIIIFGHMKLIFLYGTSLCQIKNCFFLLNFITFINVGKLLFSSIASDWNK